MDGIEDMSEPKTFSVIIPAYNCEDSLVASAMSALGQLGANDELIIVDDCSTDGTYAVASGLADGDPRVRTMRMPRNSGCAAARCAGVLSSTGERVLFLDADDEYLPGMMGTIRKALEEDPADILHFGIELRVLNEDGSYYVDKRLQEWFSPRTGILRGDDVFRSCFIRHEHQWNLVNKCFDGELMRRACCFAPQYRIQRGEDAFLYFVTTYFAQSYRGLEDAYLYAYHLGAGEDSMRRIGVDAFAGLCRSVDAVRAIDDFLTGQQCLDGVYREGFSEVRRVLVDGISHKLRTQVHPEDVYLAMQAFSEAWGAPAMIASLARIYNDDIETLSDALAYPTSRQLRPGDTIASFYWCFTGGGAENVQRMLVSLWKSMGLNVVLLLEREPDAEEIAKLGVEWRILPAVADCGQSEERLSVLESIVDEFDIKGIVYHQWLYRQLFWDQMLMKMRGLPFYIHCHGIFVHCMEYDDVRFSTMPYMYQHADGIVSLSETDAMWWRLFNPRTFVTVNPSLYSSAEVGDQGNADEKRILWLGRVAPEKRPFDALEVFAKVLRQVPDAKLDFVGGSADPNYETAVHEKANELGIDGSVNFTGWSNEQELYYHQAHVFLMTSAPTEGYPLTLGECQAFGIPCVMYDLPYLTLVRASKGIRTVRPLDQDAAANALVLLLTDKAEYDRMHEGALAMAHEVEQFDFAALWTEVLFTTHRPEDDLMTADNIRIAAEVLLTAHKLGHEFRIQQNDIHNAPLHEQIAARARELEDVRNSKSFKLGRMMTAMPRMARDAIRARGNRQ